MRRLLLLRHSESERSEPGTSDRARVLTESGRKDAARLGAYMARHVIVPDRVLMSPALRSRQTWKYVSRAFDATPKAQEVNSLYDATAQAIFNIIAEIPADARSILIIGHNPALHDLALLLIASGDIESRELLQEDLPTSGLVIVEFAFEDWARLHPRAGRLERFVGPKSIEPATS